MWFAQALCQPSANTTSAQHLERLSSFHVARITQTCKSGLGIDREIPVRTGSFLLYIRLDQKASFARSFSSDFRSPYDDWIPQVSPFNLSHSSFTSPGRCTSTTTRLTRRRILVSRNWGTKRSDKGKDTTLVYFLFTEVFGTRGAEHHCWFRGERSPFYTS
jgi:hypothetical protein